MSCCPEASFEFLERGVQVRERVGYGESYTLQFFPYSKIQTVRYAYDRDDREGLLSIWVAGNGTPGAGGLSWRWRFPCGDAGRTAYQDLLGRLPV